MIAHLDRPETDHGKPFGPDESRAQQTGSTPPYPARLRMLEQTVPELQHGWILLDLFRPSLDSQPMPIMVRCDQASAAATGLSDCLPETRFVPITRSPGGRPKALAPSPTACRALADRQLITRLRGHARPPVARLPLV